MKKLFLMLTLLPILCWADPAPLGFEINKAHYNEVKKAYRGQETGINKFSQGPMYRIPAQNIDMAGLKDVVFTFNHQGILQYVQMTFNSKNKFDELASQLASKYKMTKKQRPHVGNRYAEYHNGNSKILLEAPHMSFDTTLTYVSNQFLKAYQNISQNEEQQRKNKQKSML